jgi:hypothetical protein
VCDCSDQAAHYHNLGPKLGASLLTRHIGWKQKKKVKKKIVMGKTIQNEIMIVIIQIYRQIEIAGNTFVNPVKKFLHFHFLQFPSSGLNYITEICCKQKT